MKKWIGFSLLAALFLVTACNSQNKQEASEEPDKTTKIVLGSVDSDADIWRFIAESDLTKKAGLTIEVKEINGGPQLNNATVEEQVDVNAFQSLGYLRSFNQDSNQKLVPIATTYMEPMGLYSDKYKSVGDIKDGAVVAIADNPANTARGLRLMETAGLIKLAKDFDNGTGTSSDIVENPKQLEFKMIDDTTGPRVLQDVDLALISNTIAFEGGLNVLKDALFKEEIDENTQQSINVLVTKEDRQQDQTLKKLAELYHNQAVKDYIQEHFGGTKVDVQEDVGKLWEADQ
ncbi:metal ABC transporter substrate-binding protein [Enterococcus silesiacus]|uniref:Lipoprotein n=1 Tax=Enterococcus silesiacus TaxID=332949 RepID=A0A0S3KB12_9ENTE|nr:MetQ/NlpA family ABC transporter substrate-binding protein [Enterococcus silesiacus]ALS01412.1 metal ABC transporter substrate-binding protein [Enterococcus silesiacus]OJG85657.1 YaeC family lipoprotein [Enterococcus silesiacus]